MTRVATSYNNFARAKIDHDLSGRYDLPVYTTAVDVCDNFITNAQGNAIYRSGLEFMLTLEDAELIEFKFNNTQAYICVFTAGHIRFLAYDTNGNFGWVLNGGVPLDITNPYTLAECKELDFTQNGDYMVFTHGNHEPRKLIRTAANNFTFYTYVRTDDPFATYAATKAITAGGITQAANAVVNLTAHGYTNGQRVKFAAVVGMTQINGQTGTVTVINANQFSVNINSTSYTAWASGGTTALISTSDYPSCCLFYKGRLYFAASPLKITTIWSSKAGLYDVFTFPGSPAANDAFTFSLVEISQKIEWLFPGNNSLVAGAGDGVVAINGGSAGTAITAANFAATLTDAEPANSAYPLAKDGYVFYANRTGRNMNYFSYDLLTERYTAEDANFISYDITRGGMTKFRQKKDRNDLIFSLCAGNLLSVNFKKKENIIGWHRHQTNGTFNNIAVIPDNKGNSQLFCMIVRNGVYTLERLAPFVEFSERAYFFTGEESDDTDAYTRKVAEELKGCIYLDCSQTVSGIKSNALTYSPGAGTITATTAVFNAGHVGRHIVYKTATGYESGRFEITGYTSSTVVTVDVLQTPTSNTYTEWYLSFRNVTGLTQYIGKTIGVVTDGGYLTDFLVPGSGEIDLGKQVTQAVLGYKYRGVLKSFCIGFVANGMNTQTTYKTINRIGMRCTTTAGGKFGTSLYNLEPFQKLKQGNLNYLPPIPIDGTEYIESPDNSEIDKYFYVVQDEPLPMNVGAIMLEVNYGI